VEALGLLDVVHAKINLDLLSGVESGKAHVWTTGASKRIPQEAASTTARRLWRGLGRPGQSILLRERDLARTPTFAPIQQNDLSQSIPQLLFFLLGQPARTAFTRLLPPRAPGLGRFACGRTCSVRIRQQALRVDRAPGWSREVPDGLLGGHATARKGDRNGRCRFGFQGHGCTGRKGWPLSDNGALGRVDSKDVETGQG